MDNAAKKFRNSCIEILGFLSSPKEQIKFASKVKYIDYKSEFSSWWFDDLVMDSLPNGTSLISQSFTEREKLVLWEFTCFFDKSIESQDQSIDELLDDCNWQNIIESARVAYKGISNDAT